MSLNIKYVNDRCRESVKTSIQSYRVIYVYLYETDKCARLMPVIRIYFFFYIMLNLYFKIV